MIRRTPISTRTDTLFPYTTLFRSLVDEPLVEPAMLAEKEALIRGVDDDGIFRDAVLVEPVEQPADILVDRHDGAQVALDVALVLEVVQLLPRVEGEARSEDRRVGKECVSRCRSRW